MSKLLRCPVTWQQRLHSGDTYGEADPQCGSLGLMTLRQSDRNNRAYGLRSLLQPPLHCVLHRALLGWSAVGVTGAVEMTVLWHSWAVVAGFAYGIAGACLS